MRSALYLVSLALAASTAMAQADLSKLPKCASPCLINVVQDSGCNRINYNCICSNMELLSNLSCCIYKSCSPEDQAAVVQFANQICVPVGVTPPQSASCAGSAAPSATSAPASDASQTGAMATVTNMSASSGMQTANTAAGAGAASPTSTGAAHALGRSGELSGAVGALVGAAALWL